MFQGTRRRWNLAGAGLVLAVVGVLVWRLTLSPADQAQDDWMVVMPSGAGSLVSAMAVDALPEATPGATDPAEALLASGEEVARRDGPRGGDGSFQRVRLVRGAGGFRMLRVEEQWRLRSGERTARLERRELFAADQIIVSSRVPLGDEVVRQMLARVGCRLATRLAEGTWSVMLPGAGLDAVPDAVRAIGAAAGGRLVAEADGVGFGGAVPNDTRFPDQWACSNTGQLSGVVDADVNAPEAWDIATRADSVVVAILDSGFTFGHSDLGGLAWRNAGEVPGDALDNDGNGYVNDTNGWDFVNSDSLPADDHDHGSHVTGILAANRNNSNGVAGMAGGARIMVCKILDSFNSGLTSHLIAATSYARLAGADIINLSLQNYPFSSSLQTEFNRCESNGVLLCICAGNNSQNNDGTPNYPSCYTNANIIAVGNHTRSDARYTTSSYGLTSVDLFAPGRDILSPVSSGGYSLFTGTSMSTPFVAGTAALIKALNPTWKAAQIKQCLLNTVTIRAAYSNLCVTGGRLNAAAAVTKAVKSLPANDADGDGVASLVEYGARTDASDARSRPVFTTCFTTGTFQLVLNATVRTDVVFRVEHSTNLLAWSTNGVQNLGTSNVFSQGASVTGRPVLFQRIQAVAAP